jgi:hypothetical protein
LNFLQFFNSFIFPNFACFGMGGDNFDRGSTQGGITNRGVIDIFSAILYTYSITFSRFLNRFLHY